MSNARDVLSFWFEEIESAYWFKKDDAFDRTIQSRFSDTIEAARVGELYEWRSDAKGRLAEIIVLDQFTRNAYRDSALAFASDPLAVVLTQEAIHIGVDQELETVERSFLYMPLMHSESVKVHELAMQCFDQPGLENNLEYEKRHKEIIDRFGRYPHRNAILGRESTAEEIEFLQQPGSSF